MADKKNGLALRIGELAAGAATTVDTVRYYERLGLLARPGRARNGYRLYSEADQGRLHFVRRARRLGFSLEEIRGLLGVAESGDCRPLRQEVAELLRRKIETCESQMAELAAFKTGLEERYRLALERADAPGVRLRSLSGELRMPSHLDRGGRPRRDADSGRPRRRAGSQSSPGPSFGGGSPGLGLIRVVAAK